ncbi:hypothetical protein BC830DRAFT_121329 [Chytriomyces sp. MP71]|nr:hypothetical protein BC830DRAFT_121329 [Chytriomyces sp. MP71]
MNESYFYKFPKQRQLVRVHWAIWEGKENSMSRLCEHETPHLIQLDRADSWITQSTGVLRGMQRPLSGMSSLTWMLLLTLPRMIRYKRNSQDYHPVCMRRYSHSSHLHRVLFKYRRL